MVSVEDLVEQLRIKKAETEIATLRRALSLAETAFSECVEKIKPGMTEKELAWIMEKGMRETGAEGLSFPTIVASGPNSALPHAIPGDRRINTGEPILFDWGARLDGYCSDISRTVVIGEPDDTFKKVFRTVLDAQRRAVEMEVERLIRDWPFLQTYLMDTGPEPFFVKNLEQVQGDDENGDANAAGEEFEVREFHPEPSVGTPDVQSSVLTES